MKLSVFLILTIIFKLSSPDAAPSKLDEDEKIYTDFTKIFKDHARYNETREFYKQNVVNNFKIIRDHNARYAAGLETFNKTLYEFSSLSEEQFANFRLGAPEPDPNELKPPVDESQIIIDLNLKLERLEPVPRTYFRWSDFVIGPVKNQGDCNSCYSFTAIGVIKSRRAIKYKVMNYDLSEQEAMDCTLGCGGGWDYAIYRYYSQKYKGAAA